jgi:cation diffusion facilitator family transporter
MNKYPQPLLPPYTVYQERAYRSQQVIFSAKIGILIRSVIILFELLGVLLFNSSALFLDAVASIADILSTVFLIVCIKLAERPPDREHPFGHGRYEPLGGFLLGILLIALGGIMFFQQGLEAFQDRKEESMHPWAWIFPFVAILLLEFCYRFVNRIAKKQNSPALAADAVHYRIDSLTSLFATLALILAAYMPEWGVFVDHMGAIVIAIFMIGLGVAASRSNLNQIMDKVPDSLFFEKVRQAANKVKGVKGTEKIRIQSYGPDAHVDIDIEVEPQLSVEAAHKISQEVRVEIQKEWAAVRDVTVHIEPYYMNDH